MNDRLIQDLERILKNNPFVLLDNCTINVNPENQIQAFLKSITSDTKTNAEFLPAKIQELQKLHSILDSSVSYVTDEIFDELNEGIRIMKQCAKKDICGFENYRKNRKQTSTQELRQIVWEEIYSEIEKIKDLLVQRKAFFLNKDLHNEVFTFFKDAVRPYSKSIIKLNEERRRMRKKDYHFGDESLSAAVLYFTLTGENECPTTVVSADYDIKKELRNAYQLCMAARPKEFMRLIKITPFKGYFLTGEKIKRYAPVVETNSAISMGNLTPQFMGEQKFKEIAVYAGEIIDKACKK